jgi:hypothetical protein
MAHSEPIHPRTRPAAAGPALLGPTFALELHAAGLANDGLLWDAERVHHAETLSDSKRATLNALIAAHNPATMPPAPKTESETLVEALVEEGVIPVGKRAAILARVRGHA